MQIRDADLKGVQRFRRDFIVSSARIALKPFYQSMVTEDGLLFV